MSKIQVTCLLIFVTLAVTITGTGYYAYGWITLFVTYPIAFILGYLSIKFADRIERSK